MSSVIPTESLKLTEARATFSAVLDRVFLRRTRVRLYKGSTPVAAIVSIGDLERLEMLDKECENAGAKMSETNNALRDASEEELEAHIYEIVAQVRREMWAERTAPKQS